MVVTLAFVVHVLLAVVWVGGMFFAHMALRPAAEFLELRQRVLLWHGVLARFMPWVWGAAVLLPASGYGIIWLVFGGMATLGWHIWLMQGVGWGMILLFMFMFFRPYQRMRHMVREELFPEAGLYLLRIRRVVTLNLVLGLAVVAVVAGGRYG